VTVCTDDCGASVSVDNHLKHVHIHVSECTRISSNALPSTTCYDCASALTKNLLFKICLPLNTLLTSKNLKYQQMYFLICCGTVISISALHKFPQLQHAVLDRTSYSQVKTAYVTIKVPSVASYCISTNHKKKSVTNNIRIWTR